MQISIIDYGMGNLSSIQNILKRIGADSRIIEYSNIETEQIDALIIPGVGAFDNAMKKLKAGPFEKLNQLRSQGKPILGICLGMQLLFEKSEEGNATGLCWINGQVNKFDHSNLSDRSLKIPHMGWSYLKKPKSKLFFELEYSKFYFVHSYHVVCDEVYTIASANYGYEFTCAVNKDNLWGVQFHPEKSHKFGMRLLKNFVGICTHGS